MRIKLKKGDQRTLIMSAKQGKTWAQLGNILGMSGEYLRIDLCNEKRLLSSEIFNTLCNMVNQDMTYSIIKKLDDNWGRSLGGKNSSGSTKRVAEPVKNEELAELIGIILGDGSLYCNSEKGVYALKIAGDGKNEQKYMDFVKSLIEKTFHIDPKKEIRKNEIFISVYSKEIILRLEELGLKRGNKKINNIGIPVWIKQDKNLLKSCIRGLIDTDGSIFKMSKRDSNLYRISFKNKARKLLDDVREGLLLLNFSPSKIIQGEQIFISRKENIKRYINEVKFHNPKHIKRSPVV